MPSGPVHIFYAVFALGSPSYPDFCGCGRRVDEDLARRGARRLLPRVECDVKIKVKFESWPAQVEAALGQTVPRNPNRCA